MIINKDKRLNKILILALLIRVVVLLCTFQFSDYLTTGYLRSNYDSDDLRYLDGAKEYSKTANKLIDLNAFAISFIFEGDHTGTSEGISLWYWIMAILMYCLKSEFLVKMVNILLAVGCVYLIYSVSKKAYPNNIEVRYKAAKWYALLPYPVFFCCFMYKDQFLCFLILLIFNNVLSFVKKPHFLKLVYLLLLLVAFNFTRSALLPVIVFSMGLLLVFGGVEGVQLSKKWKILLSISSVLLLFILYRSFSELILQKMDSYVLGRSSDSSYDNTTIKYFLINSPYDIWKVPFTFCVNLIQPIYLGGGIMHWESVASLINFVFFPVVIGNFFYIFFLKKNNVIFYVSIMVLYTVLIIVSIGITRQSYFMLPFSIIFYSDYILSSNKHNILIKRLSTVTLVLYLMLIIPVFILNIFS